MSDGFKYKPLDPECIRLLHVLPESTADDIRCQLIDYSPDLSKRNHFAALSYCWGDPTPVATITIDEQPFGVAQNLFDFLQNRFLHGEHELDHGPASPLSSRGLWVDAICINQSDNEEKSYQVQNMWRVYSCADLVVAWLGKEKAFTASAFRRLQSACDTVEHYTESESLDSLTELREFYNDEFSDLRLLFHETYFSRMWVVQEVVCSDKHLVLHSGPHVVPFRSLHDLERTSRFPHLLHRRGIFDRSITVLLKMRNLDKNMTTGSLFLRFRDIMPLLESKQCSDRRDKIFALRNLPTARLLESKSSIPLFVVDYSMSVNETAVATLASLSKLETSLRQREINKCWVEIAVALALGVDFHTEEFRTWLMGKIYQDDERGVLEMVTDSGKRIDCQCFAIRDILEGSPTMT